MNIVYWIFPETKGLGLEEVAEVFGEDVTLGYQAGDKALAYGLDESIKRPASINYVEDSDIKGKSPV